jgi:hypothetical protein
MVYYVSVRKKRKSYRKNSRKKSRKNSRKNSGKNSRKNKYRGGVVTMNFKSNNFKSNNFKRTILHPPPPQGLRDPYNQLFDFTRSQDRAEFMMHLVNNMLTPLLKTIDSNINKLRIDSTNRQKLEMFRIIVDNVITTITKNPDTIYDILISDTYINYDEFKGLLNPLEEKMQSFIADTTQFNPFQKEAKQIAINVIKWINQAFVPKESKSNFSPDFKISHRVNGIWSMFGDEGKRIVEEAE